MLASFSAEDGKCAFEYGIFFQCAIIYAMSAKGEFCSSSKVTEARAIIFTLSKVKKF